MATISTERLDDPILIYAGFQGNGVTFALHPRSRRRIKEKCPRARTAPDTIFFSFDSLNDRERALGPVWNQLATLITGLKNEDISALGGVRVYDPEGGEVLREWVPGDASME